MTTEKFEFNTLPLVIIPAAGFGIRVGQPEAKELLLNRHGEPLISLALNQAKCRGWPVHVITRKEKKSLIEFLKQYSSANQMDIQIQLIESSREWPDTVLQSQKFWRDRNLLCLPDTEFEPLKICDDLVEALTEPGDVAMAVFEVQDYENWGMIRPFSGNQFAICEKPQSFQDNMKAWGLSAFTGKGGLELFQAQLKSTFDHSWIVIKSRIHLFELQSFKDLTRISQSI